MAFNGIISKQVVLSGFKSTVNASTTLLAAGATFTGTFEKVLHYQSLIVSVRSGKSGTLYVDFSDDGVTVDSTFTCSHTANIDEAHRFTLTRPWFRVRFTNTAATDQTLFRLSNQCGPYAPLTFPRNMAVQQDADAAIVRAMDPTLDIVQGLYDGYSIVMKHGRNPTIAAGTLPEDLWAGGGIYSGFPTGAPEEFQVFSSNAGDTGTLTFEYLPTKDSTAYLTATVVLQGTTVVNTGVTGYRCNSARYNTGAATTFNLGTITLRHRTTTANIFFTMPIGYSKTAVAAYTVPAGSTLYIKSIFVRVLNPAAGRADGALWIREDGKSPQLYHPFNAANGAPYDEVQYGGIVVVEKTDFILRVLDQANTPDVIGGYDCLLIKNQ